MVIYNKTTGTSFEVDPAQYRIRRMQKRIFSWADAMSDYIQAGDYRLVMFTLTYAEVGDWRPNHIREFMLRLRKVAGSGLMAYAWVAELQKRGAVHYHLLVLARKGTNLPMPDKSGLWPHGLTQTDKARTVYYICKYTGKEYQKTGPFPKGLRMFSVWISKKTELGILKRFLFRVSSLPSWLADRIKEHFDHTGQALHARRRPGGGWVDDAGEKHTSQWTALHPDLWPYVDELGNVKPFEKGQIPDVLVPAFGRANRLYGEREVISREWQDRAMKYWGSCQ